MKAYLVIFNSFFFFGVGAALIMNGLMDTNLQVCLMPLIKRIVGARY